MTDHQIVDSSFTATLGEPHHPALEPVSDIFTPNGRSKIHVHWEPSVAVIDEQRCEFTDRVRSRATEDFRARLDARGIPFDVFRAQRQPISVAHNRQDTPEHAAGIERFAPRG